MKNRKYELNLFTLFDYTQIQRHLEKMAAKGWMLEKTNTWIWEYRRSEPKKLRFSIAYFPKASVFDPAPTEAQKTYWEFCEESGWRKVADLGCMQIFCNEAEDPTPIETDPLLQVQNIHASLRTRHLLIHAFFLVYAVFVFCRYCTVFANDPVKLLASGSMIGGAILLALVVLWSVCLLCVYIIWYFRAKRMAKRDAAFLAPTGGYWLNIGMLLIATLGMVSLLFASNVVLRTIVIAAAVIYAVGMGLLFILRDLQKKDGTSKAANMMTAAFGAVALTFLICFTIPHIAEWTDDEAAADDLVITATDLIDVVDSSCYLHSAQSDTSIFLEQYTGSQLLRNAEDDYPQLRYTVTKVKVPALYDLCRENLLPKGREAVPQDAALWDAESVWLVHNPDFTCPYYYYICYSDRTVVLSLNWPPTETQIAVAVEILQEA